MPLSENHTPRSSHRTPAPGPIASRDAPNRTRAGRRTRFLRRSDRPLPRYAGPPRDTARALRSQLAMQSSRRATPRDRIRGKGIATPEQPQEPKQSSRAQLAHARMGRLRQRARVCWAPIASKRDHVLRRHRTYRGSPRPRVTRLLLGQAYRSLHRCRQTRSSVSSRARASIATITSCRAPASRANQESRSSRSRCDATTARTGRAAPLPPRSALSCGNRLYEGGPLVKPCVRSLTP